MLATEDDRECGIKVAEYQQGQNSCRVYGSALLAPGQLDLQIVLSDNFPPSFLVSFGDFALAPLVLSQPQCLLPLSSMSLNYIV